MDDAELLVVTTAIEYYQQPNIIVTVHGNDTDLLVLLVHYFGASTSDRKLLLKTKTASWDIGKLVLAINNEVFHPRFLALHALSGCDTTSRTYGKGKDKFYNVDKENTRYWEAVDMFYDAEADKESITAAGEIVFLTVFDADDSISTLDLLRAKHYEGKTGKATALVKAQSLPPTSDAASFHALRAYLQTQVWMGNTSLDPTNFGFHTKSVQGKDMMLPTTIQREIAPDAILNIIHCGCKGACDTKKCTCYKASIPCRLLCTNCNGLSCENIVIVRLNLANDHEVESETAF